MTPEADIPTPPLSREHNPWRHLPGQLVLRLSKVRLVERKDADGKKQLVDNTDSPEVIEELNQVATDPTHSEHKKWQALNEQISSGHKVAKFVVGAGIIIVTIASVGYETFVREGKDVKPLVDLIKDRPKKKK